MVAHRVGVCIGIGIVPPKPLCLIPLVHTPFSRWVDALGYDTSRSSGVSG
jgi:hypothetical protein